MGVGTIVASVFGNRISRRFGPGPSLVLGFAICGAGWLLLSLAPANAWGVAAFALMLMMFSTGAVLIFINFLALRQAVTPAPLLGRMTSTMRWLILIPAGPGALIGGWLGEHVGLRASLAFAGGAALLLAWWPRTAVIRDVRELPARARTTTGSAPRPTCARPQPRPRKGADAAHTGEKRSTGVGDRPAVDAQAGTAGALRPLTV